jgi:transposase-like protein
MSSKKRSYKNYSPELKLDAIQRVLAGESVKIVAKQLEVTDPDYIYKRKDSELFISESLVKSEFILSTFGSERTGTVPTQSFSTNLRAVKV